MLDLDVGRKLNILSKESQQFWLSEFWILFGCHRDCTGLSSVCVGFRVDPAIRSLFLEPQSKSYPCSSKIRMKSVLFSIVASWRTLPYSLTEVLPTCRDHQGSNKKNISFHPHQLWRERRKDLTELDFCCLLILEVHRLWQQFKFDVALVPDCFCKDFRDIHVSSIFDWRPLVKADFLWIYPEQMIIRERTEKAKCTWHRQYLYLGKVNKVQLQNP